MIAPKAGERILPWATEVTARVNRLPMGGTALRRHTPGQGGLGPFEVYRSGGTESGSAEGGYASLKVKVAFGTIAMSEQWDSAAMIAGLEEEEFTLSGIGNGVYIEVDWDSSGVPTFTLHGGPMWESFPEAYEKPGDVDDPTQTWWQLLAIVRAPRSGEAAMKLGGASAVLEQQTRSDLAVRRGCAMASTEENIYFLAPWPRVQAEEAEEA